MADAQFLRDSEVLETVENRANEMATEVSKVLLYSFIHTVAIKTNQEFSGMVVMSPDNDMIARAMVRAI